MQKPSLDEARSALAGYASYVRSNVTPLDTHYTLRLPSDEQAQVRAPYQLQNLLHRYLETLPECGNYRVNREGAMVKLSVPHATPQATSLVTALDALFAIDRNAMRSL